MENWKTVEGYENLYVVSDTGNIKGEKRGKILTAHPNKGTGYFQVMLWDCGKIRLKYVHRLVATAFLENPHGYKYVTHIDGDLSNNRVENLQWVKTPNKKKLHPQSK